MLSLAIEAVQAIDYGDAQAEQLTDAQLYAIAAGGLTETNLLALPPPDSKARNS